MKKCLLTVFVGVGLIAGVTLLSSTKAAAVKTQPTGPVFDADGKLKLPTGYRRWVFVGAPSTPNGLNTWKRGSRNTITLYLKTGSFPEGTVIVKELTRVLDPTFPDGSRSEPSGRGYFNRAYNGMDVTVKDSKRFAKTNGWGFFNFGHHPEPYAETSAEASASECAGCHAAYVVKTDMTWVQFYPMLRK